MLEGGADIRFVQVFLGHSKLETTEVYTHVAITKLKEVYAATHPVAKLRNRAVARGAKPAGAEATQLLAALVEEAKDEPVGWLSCFDVKTAPE